MLNIRSHARQGFPGLSLLSPKTVIVREGKTSRSCSALGGMGTHSPLYIWTSLIISYLRKGFPRAKVLFWPVQHGSILAIFMQWKKRKVPVKSQNIQ